MQTRPSDSRLQSSTSGSAPAFQPQEEPAPGVLPENVESLLLGVMREEGVGVGGRRAQGSCPGRRQREGRGSGRREREAELVFGDARRPERLERGQCGEASR